MREYIEEAMSFGDYTRLIDRLLQDGKTTGPQQSDQMLHFARLNRQRMMRLEKTIELDADVQAAIVASSVNWIWLVITEGWCGDAAQSIPVIEKLAAANSGITTRYVLRDENLEFMDRFLTNGARSIPKLLVIGEESMKVVGTWGPRPDAAQKVFKELKSAGNQKLQIMEAIKRWYNEDKSRSMQAEFVSLIEEWADASNSRVGLVTAAGQ